MKSAHCSTNYIVEYAVCKPIGKSLDKKTNEAFHKAVLKHAYFAKAMIRELQPWFNEWAPLHSNRTLRIEEYSKLELVDMASEWDTRAPTLLMLLAAAGK